MKSGMFIYCALFLALSAAAAEKLDPELTRQARTAIAGGLQWLEARQAEDGHWSEDSYPSLTGLPLWALVKGASQNRAVISNAVQFILTHVKEDGSIYKKTIFGHGGGMPNYNTAICMVALYTVGDPKLVPVVQNARTYLAANQYMEGEDTAGGMGYGKPAKVWGKKADLSNSFIVYEAMRITETVEDLRQGTEKERADLDWEAARQFIQRVHNHPDYNEKSWATDDPKEKGGFVYSPVKSRAGTFKDENGVVKFRSYGSMTYAGLLSYIYTKVEQDDPRVKSTFDWAINHWTLKENPGVGQEGVFYFYNVMSKGLHAFGVTTFEKEGKKIDWREELIKKLLSLQKTNEKGEVHWVNESGRYWESNPVLVTSYSILALIMALEETE